MSNKTPSAKRIKSFFASPKFLRKTFLLSDLCVPDSVLSVLILVFQRPPQLQLKNRHWQVADASMPKRSRTRIENRHHRRILRYRLHAALLIANDAKRPLRPSQNAIRLARPL